MGISLKLPQNPISVLFEVLKLIQLHFTVSGELGLTIFEISLTSHGKTLVEKSRKENGGGDRLAYWTGW